MCPVLTSLGPWNLAVLPIVIALIYAIALVWLWAESRWGEGKPVTWQRALIALAPAAALGLVIFLLVNRFHPVEIKAWGTMLVLGFAAGTAFMARFGNRQIMTPADCLDFALFCLIGAILGARLIFVGLEWGAYFQHPEKLLNVWEGGLSFHGGLLGAVLGAWIFSLLRHKHFPSVADEGAPAILLGYALARIGCFLNGCCHGHPTDLPWAMRFPHGEISDVPVHPTQLYALVIALIMFGILVKLRGKFPRPGHLFLAFLALYSIYRFLIEFTRAGATGRIMDATSWMTVGQLASVIILIVAVAIIALTWHRKEPSVAGHRDRRK